MRARGRHSPGCGPPAGRPDAPRPVAADDLLPERALGGDPAAHRRLTDSVVAPLDAAGGELLRTLAVYVEGGGALEACARALYVHPNTVRYRLRRIGEITGHSPTDPRDSFVLRTALVVSRLQDLEQTSKLGGRVWREPTCRPAVAPVKLAP